MVRHGHHREECVMARFRHLPAGRGAMVLWPARPRIPGGPPPAFVAADDRIPRPGTAKKTPLVSDNKEQADLLSNIYSI
jgi:hypothetical protein